MPRHVPPKVAHFRAQVAGLRTHKYADDDPAVITARTGLTAAKLAHQIGLALTEEPTLTDMQRRRLAAQLLGDVEGVDANVA